ncbi:MAG: glycosyltransferase family 1 protein, partial [Acidisphaera sp.]|nr:glycosyltransferase family 1 protein [Acidisphaera sp.]
TGFLVAPGQVKPLVATLRGLALAPTLRRRFGDAGRTRACELYDEAKVVARTIAALGLGLEA